MTSQSRYERFHWAAFNVLARMFGYGLVLVSGFFIVLTVLSFLAVTPWDYPIGLLLLFVPLFLVGVLMIRAKPYDPRSGSNFRQ